jgi:putative hydrolase
MNSMELDAKGLSSRLAQAGRRLMSKDTPIEERNPIYLLASEEQRNLLDQIQALMAVVEGHGNYVMDAVGEQVIPSFKQMRGVFQRRRKETSRIQRAINHAIGLEMKMRQYEVGQKFCEAVVKREGPAALSQLWVDPDQFPTMAELREPDLWLRRVAA